MLVPRPPLSNAERQRKFRKQNPGYRNRFRSRFTPATAPAPVTPLVPAAAPVSPTAAAAAAAPPATR